jgi:hypothetical protein
MIWSFQRAIKSPLFRLRQAGTSAFAGAAVGAIISQLFSAAADEIRLRERMGLDDPRFDGVSTLRCYNSLFP